MLSVLSHAAGWGEARAGPLPGSLCVGWQEPWTFPAEPGQLLAGSESLGRDLPLCCSLSFWAHAGSLLTLFSSFFLLFFKPVEFNSTVRAPLRFFPYRCH